MRRKKALTTVLVSARARRRVSAGRDPLNIVSMVAWVVSVIISRVTSRTWPSCQEPAAASDARPNTAA